MELRAAGEGFLRAARRRWRWWLAVVLVAALYGFHYGGIRGIFWLPLSVAVLVAVARVTIAALSALGPTE